MNWLPSSSLSSSSPSPKFTQISQEMISGWSPNVPGRSGHRDPCLWWRWHCWLGHGCYGYQIIIMSKMIIIMIIIIMIMVIIVIIVMIIVTRQDAAGPPSKGGGHPTWHRQRSRQVVLFIIIVIIIIIIIRKIMILIYLDNELSKCSRVKV